MRFANRLRLNRFAQEMTAHLSTRSRHITVPTLSRTTHARGLILRRTRYLSMPVVGRFPSAQRFVVVLRYIDRYK